MHAPDGADHVASLVLALHRVARTLQERDVPIAADHRIEGAVVGGVHEEAHVARVQPVVAAGDHDAGRTGRRWGRVGDREPGPIGRGHDVPGHAGGRGSAWQARLVLLAHDQTRPCCPESVHRLRDGPVDDLGRRHPSDRLRQEEALDGREGGRGARGRRDAGRRMGRERAAGPVVPPPGGSARRPSAGRPGSPPRPPATWPALGRPGAPLPRPSSRAHRDAERSQAGGSSEATMR